MNWKTIFGLLFLLSVTALLIIYWFIPFNSSDFFIKNKGTNFSLNNESDMQFYANMRFPSPQISYKIDNCPLQKQDDMKRGFDIIKNLTILDFYSVDSDEQITVTCSSKNKIEEGLFIAGEGGPTNISKGDKYNVIFSGTILLIKDSNCPNPNVAMHELFHVLGFKHSSNPNSIMYNVSKCSQEIGEDMINFINELYSVPSYADLSFEDASARMSGKYLSINFTIRNYGLEDAEASQVKIYADGKLVKTIDINGIQIGYGNSVYMANLFVAQLSVKNLEFVIETNMQELDKENNKVSLQIQE